MNSRMEKNKDLLEELGYLNNMSEKERKKKEKEESKLRKKEEKEKRKLEKKQEKINKRFDKIKINDSNNYVDDSEIEIIDEDTKELKVIEEKKEEKIKKEKPVKEDNDSKAGRMISKILLDILLILFITVFIIFCIARIIGTGFIQTKNIDLTSINDFYGVKIVQISDILYGSTITKKDLRTVRDTVNKANPDILLFTGDLINKDYILTKEDNEFLVEFLNSLNYKLGKYIIYGDYDYNNSVYTEIISKTDFTLLDNESTLIYNYSINPIQLVGVNPYDKKEIEFDYNTYTITLIHNYDLYENNVNSNVVLAGHNLGGELRLPFLKEGLLGLNNYNGYEYKNSSTNIYINNGLGTKTNVRLFNHPNISIYHFK